MKFLCLAITFISISIILVNILIIRILKRIRNLEEFMFDQIEYDDNNTKCMQDIGMINENICDVLEALTNDREN